MTDLTLYGNAKRALSELSRVDEVKSIRDKAVAMQIYAKQAKDRDLIDRATEVRLRAERRAGELLKGMAERGERETGGRPTKPSQAATVKLDDIGITRSDSSRWQRMAAMPDENFESKIASAKDKAVASLDSASDLAHRTSFTGDNQWFTPAEHIERARRVLGKIDLDPASHELAQARVRASVFFTEEDDGLKTRWRGRIWLNPPYAQPAISDFITKVVAEYAAGNIEQAIVLTHNYTDTAWFQMAAAACQAICFTRGRIRFEDPNGDLASPTQGQAFFYFGESVEIFAREFSSVGFIVSVRP